MRRNPSPDFVTFAAGSGVFANSHDHFLIVHIDGEKFIVDPTAAQFRWEDWLWSRKEYEEKLAAWTLNLAAVDAGDQMRGFDEGDWRLRATKEAIEECFRRMREGG